MSLAATRSFSSADVTLAYHARTKHHLERYAAGPETLDWEAQPNPFREFLGCPRIPLALKASRLSGEFGRLYAPGAIAPSALSIDSLSVLLELSMGLSAWKEYGPDRWALRCNPSSGNLHPTEAYVVARNMPGLEDGLYHYLSRDHVLEQRCAFGPGVMGSKPGLWIALSSIHWREAWKYGERAFRYCQLDVGHALGALRYAAGALGWAAHVVEDAHSTALAALMGLDRLEDFSGAEREDAELLIAIEAGPDAPGPMDRAWASDSVHWMGQANLLDPHPIYRWPIIDEVSTATRGRASDAPSDRQAYPPLRHPSLTKHPSPTKAAAIILNRRSAQRFDSKYRMSAETFYGMLEPLLARPIAPFDVWEQPPRTHPVLFVHRVDGLEPGLYALPRHPEAEQGLRAALSPDFVWQKPDGAPAHLPVFKLLSADCRAVAKTMSCHQAIASDGCFSLGMLSEFDDLVRLNSWHYRQLHWEAGLLGHVLYLEAEAAGLRGTGIGCYFDDTVHELLGLKTERFQSLYHFTVGRPLIDSRITSLPAYPGRRGPDLEEKSP